MEKSLTDHRNRFQQLIGAVDARLTLNPSETNNFELITTLNQSSILAKNEFVTVHRVRWPVLEGVCAEGLLLVPQTVHAAVIALPDTDWTPEMFCGLQDELSESALVVRRLAEAGCMVVVPGLLSRSDEFSGHSKIGWTNQSHLEFVYRQAFEVGRHVIGYEVQKVLAAVDLLERNLKSLPANQDEVAPKIGDAGIGVLGFGEGGLLALYAAALDPRITTCWVSDYFQQRGSTKGVLPFVSFENIDPRLATTVQMFNHRNTLSSTWCVAQLLKEQSGTIGDSHRNWPSISAK